LFFLQHASLTKHPEEKIVLQVGAVLIFSFKKATRWVETKELLL